MGMVAAALVVVDSRLLSGSAIFFGRPVNDANLDRGSSDLAHPG